MPIAQYRNKVYNRNVIEQDLKVINSIYKGKLIINDYIEFIDFADGLHIGQEDLLKYGSFEKIRAKVGEKLLGLSTHNKEEIKEANSLKLDYIGLGAYRATNTKQEARVHGDALLDIAKISKHKVALIGGVKLSDNFNKEANISYKVIASALVKEFLNHKQL